MRKLILAAVLSLVASVASAACFGSGSFYTCNDASGNNYTVNRFGDMTTMNGSNPNTGSTWSQSSTRLGNTTITNGQTNGNPWNMNQTSNGPVTNYSGTNSHGQPFSGTCVYGRC